jgi:hypothetical protein
MMDRAEIRETLDKADELVTELKAFRNLSPESGNVTQVTLNAGGVGVWIATTAAIVCLLVATFAVVIALDAKAEVRSERLSREIMNKWTAQEVTAIRSYITTGKLAPMSPPPVQPEEK